MLTAEELELRLRDDPEAAAHFAMLRAQFIAGASPGGEHARAWEAIAERLAEAFPSFRPASTADAAFDQLVRGLFDAFTLAIPWWEQLEPMSTSVASTGLIVPISRMPPAEIGAMMKAHRERGADGTIEFVRSFYDRLFACPNFLPHLREQWRADPFLSRRITPLLHAVDAHAAGLFGASVPALLAQLEGLIADASSHAGRMNATAWREHMNEAASRDPLVGTLVKRFVNAVLAAPFEHGAPITSPLSRHAILHGGDVDYGTLTNSRTAILLVDYFAFLRRISPATET